MPDQFTTVGQIASAHPVSLTANRDAMTVLSLDPDVASAITRMFQCWRDSPETATPLQNLREILEQLRRRERGAYRIAGMNTLVRMLGQRHRLADFLDMMRQAIHRDGTTEQEIALMSQTAKWHSIYGWCGQTIVVMSAPDAISATSKPNDESLAEKLEYPRAMWWMSIHVWQPNANASGFVSGKLLEPDLIMEPPHTHPFDFVSMVCVGKMRQSIYRPTEPFNGADGGRYQGVILQKVDGVWPPHERKLPAALETIQDRVTLSEGDSYYLPYDAIHDLEVSASEAQEIPAVTLFVASESLDLADVYMAESMVGYHEQHPDILNKAQPMQQQDWEQKLCMLAAYLRGESKTLRLYDLVKSETDYAFFHV